MTILRASRDSIRKNIERTQAHIKRLELGLDLRESHYIRSQYSLEEYIAEERERLRSLQQLLMTYD